MPVASEVRVLLPHGTHIHCLPRECLPRRAPISTLTYRSCNHPAMTRALHARIFLIGELRGRELVLGRIHFAW